MHGLRTAPAWIVTLDAAEAWGLPPWKIEGGSHVLWYARFEALRNAKIKKALKDSKRGK